MGAVGAVGLVAEPLGPVPAGVHERVLAVLALAHAQAGQLAVHRGLRQREGGHRGQPLHRVGGDLCRGQPDDVAPGRQPQRPGRGEEGVHALHGGRLVHGGEGPDLGQTAAEFAATHGRGGGQAEADLVLLEFRDEGGQLRGGGEPLVGRLTAPQAGGGVQERGQGGEAGERRRGEHGESVRRACPRVTGFMPRIGSPPAPTRPVP